MSNGTVVITGATSGLGEALAHALAAHGVNIVVAGRDASRTTEVAEAIGGGRAIGVGCDVRRERDIAALWEAAGEWFGWVDHWINNAGVGHARHRIDTLPVEETEAVLATNLRGALLGARRALDGMLAQGGGRIWLTEGLGSNGPALSGTGPYGASKAGATYAYRVLAKECRSTPVQIGFLRPGIMPTQVTGGAHENMPRLARALSDRPEVIARHFAPRILRADRNGQRITWLTPGRIARRLVTAPLSLIGDAAAPRHRRSPTSTSGPTLR